MLAGAAARSHPSLACQAPWLAAQPAAWRDYTIADDPAITDIPPAPRHLPETSAEGH